MNVTEAFFAGLDVLASALDEASNVVTLVLGDASAPPSAKSRTHDAEMWCPPGWVGIPAPPTSGQPSAQVAGLRGGDRDVVLGWRDVRFAGRYASLEPGEFCAHATVGQARVIGKADGSVTLYTTDSNEDGGKAVFLRIHPTDGLQFVAPWGTLIFDQLGLRVRHASGFSLRGGGCGLPAPLSALGSYFQVRASIQQYQGQLVMLGNGPVFQPVTWGAAENPLTTPGVPIAPAGFGVPCGLATTTGVRVSIG